MTLVTILVTHDNVSHEVVYNLKCSTIIIVQFTLHASKQKIYRNSKNKIRHKENTYTEEHAYTNTKKT